MITIVLYDDALETSEEKVLSPLLEYLDRLATTKTARVYKFSKAEDLIDSVIRKRIKPQFGLIDLWSEHDNPSPAKVKQLLDKAEKSGFYPNEWIDEERIKAAFRQDWLQARNYGVGVLALLRSMGCVELMALTQWADKGEIVNALSLTGLVTRGMYLKTKLKDVINRDINPIVRELIQSELDERAAPAEYNVRVDEYRENPPSITVSVSRGSKRANAELTGDPAIILRCILDRDGRLTTAKDLLSAVNKHRLETHLSGSTGREQLQPFGAAEIRTFINKYGVKLLSARLPDDRSLCRTDNKIFCEWQKSGKTHQEDEGSSCRNIVGFCPKLLMKKVVPDLMKEGNHRNVVRSMRDNLSTQMEAVLGRRIGHTLIKDVQKNKGWAVAARVQFSDLSFSLSAH